MKLEKWARRVFTISFWPVADSLLTIFSNAMLLKFGVKTAVIASVFAMAGLNLLLFNLLNKEKILQDRISKSTSKIFKLKTKIENLEIGKALACFAVFVISGPAMAGVPLLWLLKIKKKTVYNIIFLGSIVNSILWVGGVWNIFWFLVKRHIFPI